LFCRYLYDVIYITVFVQLMSIISEKFWWTYLVVRQHTPYVFLNIVLPSNRFRALACTLLGLNFTEHLYSVKSLVVVLAEQSCLIRNIGHILICLICLACISVTVCLKITKQSSTKSSVNNQCR